MIFPELPRRTQFDTTPTVETPLRGVEETTESTAIDVDEWFRQKGFDTDPAASTRMPRETGPINWWAKDAVEFYALCATMITWTVYWYGVHRSIW